MKENKKRIVVDGWYGIPNAGDEAILESIVQLVREVFDDATLVATSNDIAHTKRTHDVDDAIPRFRRRRPNITWVREIRQADELWIGGGGLFSNPGLLHYCQTIAAARALNTRVIVIGVGASGFPPDDEYADLLVDSLNHTDIITTRNKTSADALRSNGVRTSIYPLSDLVFRYTSTTTLQSPWKNLVVEPTLTVSVRKPPLNRSLNVSALADAIDDAATCLNYNVLFVPFNNNYETSDTEVANEVASLMESDATVCESTPNFRTLYEIINNSEGIVGMRLHSMIFAARSRTPFVGIAYRPKCATFLETVNREVWWCDNISPSELSADIQSQICDSFDVRTRDSIVSEEIKAELISTVITEHRCSPVSNPLFQPVAKESTKDLFKGLKNKLYSI